jgi:outer membrane protein TolC
MLLIAGLETERSRMDVGEYRAQGLPQVNGNLSLNKNLRIRTTFVPAIIFDPNAAEGELAPVQFGTPYDGDLGLSISQMLFDGSFFVGLKASKMYTNLAREQQKLTKIDVAEQVSKAYYAVLINEATLELVQTNYDRIDTLLRETRIMYENGFAEKIDVNRTQVEFNNIKTNLENTRRSLEVSKKLLKYQMGMPIEQPLEIAEDISDLNFQYGETLLLEPDVNRRVEYAQLLTQEELAMLNLKNNQFAYLPTLDLNMNIGQNAGVEQSSNLFQFGNNNYWFDYQFVGVTLSLPIFDGLRKSYAIKKIRLEQKQLQLQKENLENSIHLTVQQERNELVNNIDNLQNQQENMKLAEEVYTHAKIKYEEGVGSNLEVIEADNAYKQAQTNYFTALYNALLAKIDYERAQGILLPGIAAAP